MMRHTAIGTLTELPLVVQADDNAPHRHDRPSWSSIGRQVLPEGDGWASLGIGTTGGAAARPAGDGRG
jgi:pectate lyase